MKHSLLKHILLPLIPVLITSVSFGQKLNYTVSFETAVVNGSSGSEAAFNATFGMKFNNWNTSVGAGLDYYRFRSVPFFIDVKRFIPIGKTLPYIQASAGMNIAWPTDAQRITQKWWSSWWPQPGDTLSFGNGFYSKLNIGIVINPKNKILFAAFGGWSFKSLNYTNEELVWNGTTSVYEPRTTIYRMSRLQLGLSVSF